MHLNDVLDMTEFIDSLQPGEFYRKEEVEKYMSFVSRSRPLSDPFKTTISYRDLDNNIYRFLEVGGTSLNYLYCDKSICQD